MRRRGLGSHEWVGGTSEFAAAELPPDAKQADYAYRSGVLKWDVAQGLCGDHARAFV